MSKHQIVAAVIEQSGKFLLGKRSESKKSAPGHRSAICGRIETGETEQEAVIREVSEEVGLVVSPVSKIAITETQDGQAEIHWWVVEILSGIAGLKNDEHSELRWVNAQDMKTLFPILDVDLKVFLSFIRN